MAKQILSGQKARNKLIAGIEKVAELVGSTLGPLSSAVAIDRTFDIWINSDGVSVAKNIELKDQFENVGARLVREAAEKTVDLVGDGTTATVILTEALVKEANKQIENGANSMSLRKGLEKGRDLLLKELEKVSIPIKTKEQKLQIATISSKEKELGKLISDIVDKVGEDGVITVEESKTNETFIEQQDGMQFDKGYVSPYFITDPLRMEATVENPNILLTDKTLSNIKEILPFLEKASKESLNLVIMAPEIKDSTLASMILTKINGGMNLLAVQAPAFEQKQKDILQDIAVLTGAKVITGEAGQKFEDLEINVLGKAKRVTSTKDATLIVATQENKEEITNRIKSLKKQLEDEDNEYNKEKIKERIAKLSGGIAVIKVGGQTEVEMKERRERALDAVSATQAAVEGGIIPGGEVIYLSIRNVLNDFVEEDDTAYRILYKALETPFRKLVSNAGLDPGVYLDKVLSLPENGNEGIDVTDGKTKDLITVGIVDPTLVAKCIIQNAISVAVQIITVNGLIVNEPIKEGGNQNVRPR